MSACVANFAVSCHGESRTGVSTLRREIELNRFFVEVEKRALRIAEIGIRAIVMRRWISYRMQ